MDGCVKRVLLAAEQAELECEGWRIIAKALQAADLSEQQQKAVECALGHQISEEKLA